MYLTIYVMVGGGALFSRTLLRGITRFFSLASLYCHEMLCYHDRAVREKIYTSSTLYAYYKMDRGVFLYQVTSELSLAVF